LSWSPAEPAAPMTVGAPRQRAAPAAGRAAARILLADDNADMRAYVERLLSKHWTVESVADGAAALAAAQRDPPDLVLSDVMMPVLDGHALLRALRADVRTRLIPVVLLSARAGEEAVVEGIEAGADDYLVKPFSSRELLARVRTHLELSRLRTDNAAVQRIGILLNAQLDLQSVVQILTDEATKLCGAQFGAFFYNVLDAAGGRYMLYTLAGAPREAFADFAMPRATPLFSPTFEGEAIVRLDDVTQDPRYGKNSPHGGMPLGHLPVRSYLAAPVKSRSGEVLGGLFFGHREPGAFDERCEHLLEAIGAQAAIAIDNANLYQREQAARAEAEAANRAKDEFLAMLGHELRNPLAPIVTALQLMDLRAEKTNERERGVIQRQVAYLVRLVDDLLDVSRITRGKVEIERKPVELAQVAAKAIEVASPLLEQRCHRLRVAVPEVGLRVEGDLIRLTQIVSNLLSNAAKYTEQGGTITLSAAAEGDEAVLRVQDTGIGIDSKLLPHVFDLFMQAPQSLARSDGGLGLGLTIVRSLTTLHGGSVKAYSDGAGCGSEFVVRLPRCITARAADDVANAARPDAGARNGRRILVVDDNIDAAESLAVAISLLGHETRTAYDGPSAIKAATAFRPEVALLDLGLPVMDGYELAQGLRSNPVLSGMRLIAITGYGQEADRARTRAAGFDDHLVKPVDIPGLLNLIDRLTADGGKSNARSSA
jgi:signal transduction histidine kinase/DNA-binding response OmpR family regulator